MKLYSVFIGPPSIACQQVLKVLKLDYELVNVDYSNGKHLTDDYAKLNPQKEIPVLADGDLVMGESNAILQYLADKYDVTGELYPKDPKARALVNHRLCFYSAMYYRNILEYTVMPIFWAYERTALGLKKVNMSLDVFETYFKRENTRYAASNNITLADFQLITATMCLEAIDFSLEACPLVKQWYEAFKADYPDLWEIAERGLQEYKRLAKNPPDLSHMNHPFHPARKVAKQGK